MQEFVERTWEGVRENVTVNGCEMGEGEGGMEVEGLFSYFVGLWMFG